MLSEKTIAYVGWTAFFVSVAGYVYFGGKELTSNSTPDEKKRTAGLMASTYIGGAGTATLIVYELMKIKSKAT
jgi:hypothetical protein